MNTSVSISTSSMFPLSLEKSFALAKASKYDGIEILITGDKKTRDLNYLKHLSEKYGLPIVSFHAPTLLLTQFVWGTNPETKLMKTAELTAEAGSELVVVHPPFKWQNGYADRFLSVVEKVEKETGVKVAIENMFPWRTTNNKTYEIYKPSWEEITQEAKHLTLDFSHAALSGLNSLELAKNHWKQISHIHLCDGHGSIRENSKHKYFDEHLLPGQGSQKVAETLQFLKSVNWKGHIVAEINTRKAKPVNRLKMLKQTVAWTKEHLNQPTIVN